MTHFLAPNLAIWDPFANAFNPLATHSVLPLSISYLQHLGRLVGKEGDSDDSKKRHDDGNNEEGIDHGYDRGRERIDDGTNRFKPPENPQHTKCPHQSVVTQ